MCLAGFLVAMAALASLAPAGAAEVGTLRESLVADLMEEELSLCAPMPVADRQQGVRRVVARSVGDQLGRLPITIHRALISPQDGEPCTFRPSCSEYAAGAVQRFGIAGWVMGSDRLLRCHGGNWGDYDHVGGHNRDPVVPDRPFHVDGARAATGALLSIVPGFGQMSAGRWRDGIHALTTVGVLAFGAAAYARRDQPIAATAAAGFGLFFFAGNLYGGAMAHGRTSGP